MEQSSMKKLLIIATCSMLALPAFAETVGEKTGVNAVLGIAPTTKDFVSEVAISDMFEIQSSKLATSKLGGQEKEFADHMIMDHTKTSTELMGAAKEANVPLPNQLDSAHKSMLDKLSGLTGDDFKKEYLSDQVSAHKSAVALFKRYADGGDNPKLKSWAGTTLPALEHHLDMAQGLYKGT
jgi:putative membrane protein